MAGDSSFDQDKNKLAEYETSSSGSYKSSRGCFNSKTGELMGRNLFSWIKLLSFFFIFCGVMSTLFGLCMGIFFQTLDYYIPKLKIEDSMIGSNPGLGYRPAGGLGFKTINGDYKVNTKYNK